MAEEIKNPGSVNDFSGRLELDPFSAEAARLYGEALVDYALGLALTKRVSLEQLHELPLETAS